MARLLSLSGVSNAGKSTLAKELIRRYPRRAKFGESITTRLPRESDLEGEYVYVSEEEFAAYEAADDFLWTADYGGKRYGTRRSAILRMLQGDEEMINILILVPDVLSTLNTFMLEHVAKTKDPLDSWIACWIDPPEPGELIRRMRARGDDPLKLLARQEAEKDWLSSAFSCGKSLKIVHNNSTIEHAADMLDQYMHLHRVA